MKNLFYSKKEKCVFYIPNYYVNGTSYTDNLIDNLKKEVENLIKIGAERHKIISYEIRNSRRYKEMWVFYYFTDSIPKDAFEIGNNWTRDTWISN